MPFECIGQYFRKDHDQIFNEFEGTAVLDQSFGDGDVKYHLGYSSQVPAKKMGN